jgi:hypothetical protein
LITKLKRIEHQDDKLKRIGHEDTKIQQKENRRPYVSCFRISCYLTPIGLSEDTRS